MKNKLILMLLMLTNCAATANNKQSYHHVYRNMSEKILTINSSFIQAALICASWASKFTLYNFIEFECNDTMAFIAYNCDCNFSIRFDKETNECEVEFDANDDSYDYLSFLGHMDAFFSTL